MITERRTIEDVQEDLSHALQRKTSGMLRIGRLLNEAKELVEHGDWGPWLQRHTALGERTARNYMAAAKWVASKTATVADFEPQLGHLSPKAIYLLASRKLSAEVVERVLDAAETQRRHLNEEDVKEIAKHGAKAAILKEIKKAEAEAEAEAKTARLAEAKAAGFETVEAWDAAIEAERETADKAERAAWEAEQAEAERERAEAEAILDGGTDPDLPPTPEPAVASPEAFHTATFEKAIDSLRSVMTKPLSTFTSVKISPSDIEQITAFLQEVAKQIAEKRRAA
jgi:Protein of unknown function (DUF3102)